MSTRATDAIIEDIDRFNPVSGDWARISGLVEELMRNADARMGIRALLAVFERGAGVETGGGAFSDILHSLERLPGFERELLDSVRRRPAVFSIRMVGRLLKSGISEIDGISLGRVLVELANDPRTMRIVRSEILEVVREQHIAGLHVI